MQLGKSLQLQKLLPALRPRFAVRKIIEQAHFGHAGTSAGVAGTLFCGNAFCFFCSNFFACGGVFFFNASQSSSNDDDKQRVSLMTGIKLLSPSQRGTTWQCKCFGMPAPAAEPMLKPTLKPCGCNVFAKISWASTIVSINSARSSADKSVSVGTARYGITIT